MIKETDRPTKKPQNENDPPELAENGENRKKDSGSRTKKPNEILGVLPFFKGQKHENKLREVEKELNLIKVKEDISQSGSGKITFRSARKRSASATGTKKGSSSTEKRKNSDLETWDRSGALRVGEGATCHLGTEKCFHVSRRGTAGLNQKTVDNI